MIYDHASAVGRGEKKQSQNSHKKCRAELTQTNEGKFHENLEISAQQE
jgi:hypothetical protein